MYIIQICLCKKSVEYGLVNPESDLIEINNWVTSPHTILLGFFLIIKRETKLK